MNILNGMKELMVSPSGIFSLITLFCITFVTYKVPSVGGSAFAAFCAVIPGILAICEHRETCLQMTTSTVQTAVAAVLPDRGRLS